MRYSQRRSERRGLAAVELGILLPTIMLLVLGCIDFGRFLYVQIAVDNAASSGASYGSNTPYTTATNSLWQQRVQQAVANEMSGIANYNAASLTTSITVIAASGTEPARVQVNATYPFQTLINWPGLPNLMTLGQTVSMPAIRN